MRLVYDMRHLEERMHGMARYALDLLAALLEQAPDLEVLALVRELDLARWLPADPRVEPVDCDLPPYSLASQLKLPGRLNRLKADLYHCPFYAPPRFFRGPMVFTVHDLIHLRFPADHSAAHRLFYRLVVGPAARRAGAVFTVSRHSRDDLVALLGVDPAKVVVTPNGVGAAFSPRPRSESQAVARGLGLGGEYILGVGNPKPHKNLGALLQAHALLGAPAPELVLVGVAPGDLPAPHGAPARVHYLAHLEDRDLAALYSGAEAVAVPSLYEGFGLPALEALACGAPVVASDRASLPEVVGAAGLLCPPHPQELAVALSRLLAQPELAQSLREAGPAQARRFTWQASARATLAVYQRLVGGEA